MEKKTARHESAEVDLLKLCGFYLRHWWVILLSCAVAVSAAFVMTHYLITPQYRSEVTVYVNNTKSSQSMDIISGSNLSAAQHLVNTYVNIIESNTVLNEVISSGNLQYTPAQIRRIMTAEQVDGTEMFTVSIQHPDPQMAAHIANTIATVAPARISEFVEGSSTKIIDYAEVASRPFSPSYPRNLLLGGLFGVIAALICLTLRCLFDTRVQTEEDLRQYFDLPVLGAIPDYSGQESSQKNCSGYESAGAKEGQ